MSMLETCLKELSRGKSWSRFTCRPLQEIRISTSATWSATWEGPKSFSLSIHKGPHDITRDHICHRPLLHLAAAHQWIGVPQIHAPNLVGRGCSATIAKGLVILHMSAHSHTNPGNSSRPGLHSIKEAIPMMKE